MNYNIYSEDEYGRRITFTYCKKLYIYDKNKRCAKPVDYPVNVDYFLDQEWLLVRAKPRSNLYLYEYEEFNLDIANRTTTDQEIREVMHLVERILGTKAPRKSDKSAMTGVLKNRIFKLLDKYSQTPVEIARVISDHDEQIRRIFSMIQEICIIKNVCILPEWMKKRRNGGCFYLESDEELGKSVPIAFGTSLVIAPRYRKVLVQGMPLELTRIEFDLLHFMAKHPG